MRRRNRPWEGPGAQPAGPQSRSHTTRPYAERSVRSETKAAVVVRTARQAVRSISLSVQFAFSGKQQWKVLPVLLPAEESFRHDEIAQGTDTDRRSGQVQRHCIPGKLVEP